MSSTLPLAVDRHDASPLYRQLEQQLRAAIETRRLRPGQRLPSVRAVAGELGIGRLTVATAYERLAADGYLVGRVGFGTVVAPYAPAASVPRFEAAGPRRRPKPGPPPLPPLVVDALPAPGPAWRPNPGQPRFDLRSGPIGGADVLPSAALERHVRAAWRAVGEGRSEPLDAAGDGLLREAIAARRRARHDVRCEAGNVVVLSGASIGAAAVARLWLRAGSVTVVEDPADHGLRRALALSGTRFVPVPVDRSGLRTDGLPQTATLAVVAPSVQVPTGAAMPLARRLGLLEWAASAGVVVLEDGRADELAVPGRGGSGLGEPAGLQGLDEDGRVIALGALESVLHPGIRLAWAVVPSSLVDAFIATVAAIDPGPSPVQQQALGRFLADGHLDRHLGRLRRTLVERQERALDALRRELGWLVSSEAPNGGSKLIVDIEDSRLSAAALAATASEAGVALDVVDARRVLIDCGRLEAAALVRAIQLLGKAATATARDRSAAFVPAALPPSTEARDAAWPVAGRPGMVTAMRAAGYRVRPRAAERAPRRVPAGRDDAA